MLYDDYLTYKNEIFSKPYSPWYASNPDLSKDLFNEMRCRISSVTVTFHEFPNGQAICITDRARRKLSRDLKNIRIKLQLECDAFREAIDQIEDSFAASERRLE